MLSDCEAALLFAYSVILHAFLLSVDFFLNQPFQKCISVIPSEFQIVWRQIRPDILSGLIWVQLFAKVISQQTTLLTSRQSVNSLPASLLTAYGCLLFFNTWKWTKLTISGRIGARNTAGRDIFLSVSSPFSLYTDINGLAWKKNCYNQIFTCLDKQNIFQRKIVNIFLPMTFSIYVLSAQMNCLIN